MKIGLLCSGALGYQLLLELYESRNISFVMTDRQSTSIHDFCVVRSIPTFIGNPRNGKGRSFIEKFPIEVLISINYLFLIEKDIFSFPSLLAFNVHGSLLPKYRGRTPHVWAIINNEKEAGVTAHQIAAGCDTGDILVQIKVPINDADTGNDLLIKFREVYKKLVFEVLEMIEQNSLVFEPQNHSKATYFGKRTPADGKINWTWFKERIQNWVRAQAYPYPGAFAFYNEQKITIDEVQVADTGFSFDMPDGMIVSINPLIIKVPNGTIELLKYREKIEFKVGGILK